MIRSDCGGFVGFGATKQWDCGGCNGFPATKWRDYGSCAGFCAIISAIVAHLWWMACRMDADCGTKTSAEDVLPEMVAVRQGFAPLSAQIVAPWQNFAPLSERMVSGWQNLAPQSQRIVADWPRLGTHALLCVWPRGMGRSSMDSHFSSIKRRGGRPASASVSASLPEDRRHGRRVEDAAAAGRSRAAFSIVPTRNTFARMESLAIIVQPRGRIQ